MRKSSKVLECEASNTIHRCTPPAVVETSLTFTFGILGRQKPRQQNREDPRRSQNTISQRGRRRILRHRALTVERQMGFSQGERRRGEEGVCRWDDARYTGMSIER